MGRRQEKPTMAINQDAWKAAAANDPLACPRCLKSDKVEKVSHVVQAGQSSGYYAGPTRSYSSEYGFIYGSSAMYGSSSTELAQQLALPLAPHYRSPWKHWWMWLLLVFLAYQAVFTVVTVIGFAS